MTREDLGRVAYEEWLFAGERNGAPQSRLTDSDSVHLKCGGVEIDLRISAEAALANEVTPQCRWIDLPRNKQEVWCAIGEAVERKLAS